jgi:PAS domain-containing protein
MRILLWDDVTEGLTGVSAEDAVGRWCRDVLNGVDQRGDLARGSGGTARIASTRLVIQTEDGRRLVTVSTIAAQCAGEEPIVLELLRTGELVGANGSSGSVLLTLRQLEVLRLLAHGVPDACGDGSRAGCHRRHAVGVRRQRDRLGRHRRARAHVAGARSRRRHAPLT